MWLSSVFINVQNPKFFLKQPVITFYSLTLLKLKIMIVSSLVFMSFLVNLGNSCEMRLIHVNLREFTKKFRHNGFKFGITI